MTLQDAHDEFCAQLIGLHGQSLRTVASHRGVVAILRSDLPQLKHVEDLTSTAIERFFMHGRAVRGWAPATVNTYHKRLNVFCGWAVERGLLQTNPIRAIPRARLGHRVPKALSLEQAERLMTASSVLYCDRPYLAARNQAILALFMYAGLRRGELLGLKLSDIDDERRLLLVRAGKGDKDRTIPLAGPAIVALDAYRRARATKGRTHAGLFLSDGHDRPITNQALKRVKGRLIEGTGVRFHWHQLRHTFATLMIEGGCDIYALSKMMGHADISTTTVYLSASVRHLQGELAKHPLSRSASSSPRLNTREHGRTRPTYTGECAAS